MKDNGTLRSAAIYAPDGPMGARPVRLTSLRLAVLRAIEVQPGLSNRGVGVATRVQDEGQTSRLLRRLAEFGLIENTGGGQRFGTANSWQLTAAGYELLTAWRRSWPDAIATPPVMG